MSLSSYFLQFDVLLGGYKFPWTIHDLFYRENAE